MYLLKEFEQDPAAIWNTNLFGKPLLDLVNEGLNNKLYRMPEDARNKFRETIERVINEGCSADLYYSVKTRKSYKTKNGAVWLRFYHQ